MIMKYNIFDIGGELVRNDDICLIRENNELDNIWLKSITLFRDKFSKRMNFIDRDCVYLFLEGSGIFEHDEVINIRHNDLVFVPKNTWHRVINTGDVHMRYLVISERE